MATWVRQFLREAFFFNNWLLKGSEKANLEPTDGF